MVTSGAAISLVDLGALSPKPCPGHVCRSEVVAWGRLWPGPC